MSERTTAARRERVTPAEVAEACEGLLKQGAKPSVRLVMAAVGGGSPNTINEHLKAWRKMQQAGAAVGDGEGLLSEAFRAALAHELERIKVEARNEAASRSEELEELHALEMERAEQLQVRCNALEEALEALQDEHATSKSSFEQQVTALQAEVSAATRDLAEHTARTTGERAETQQAQQAAGEAVAKLRFAEEQLDTARQEITTLRGELQQARAEAVAAQKQVAVAEAREGGRSEHIAALKEDLQRLRGEAREALDRGEAQQRRADLAEARAKALEEHLRREESRTGTSRSGLVRQRAQWVSRQRQPGERN